MPTRVTRLHAYAASFGDDLARSYIKQHTHAGDLVVDPFVGGGTTVTQSLVLERSVLGIDVDPVACQVSQLLGSMFSPAELSSAKVAISETLSSMRGALDSYDYSNCTSGTMFQANKLAATVPNRPEIDFWFSAAQRAVLALSVASADTLDFIAKQIFRVSISAAIIRKWPNTISLAMDIDHSRPHRIERPESTHEVEIAVLSKTVNSVFKVLEIQAAECSRSTVDIIRGDAAGVLSTLPSGHADYVLTSPPYFNAIDYPRSHKFSHWWLWPDEPDLQQSQYIGLRRGKADEIVTDCLRLIPSGILDESPLRESHPSLFRSFCRYVSDLDGVLSGIHHVLKPGSRTTLVLGNNVVRKVTVPVMDIVEILLRNHGFSDVTIQSRPIDTLRRRYPYGLKGFQGLMQTEYIIEAVK